MKKVVSNEELKDKMKLAVNMLCDTVKTTLGPKGSNIIIDHSTFSPFITNDGVTIAENIESEDEVINTILEIAKEASIKTNEKVGDGTTTTLVLLQSLFNNGLRLIEEGKNPIILKKELDENLSHLLKYIKLKSIKPTKKELYNIAKISSNSDKIGKIVTEAFVKVKSKNAITIKEGNNVNDKMIIKKGYSIETLIPSFYYFKDKSKITLENPHILLVNNYINDIEEIAIVLNQIIKTNDKLIIMAEDFSDNFVNQTISLYLNENINIYLLKTPEYGKNKLDILNDIALISDGKVNDDLSYVNENRLGKVSLVTITKEETTFQIIENNNIKNKIKELKKLVNSKDDIDKNFVNKRLSMLQKGLVEIIVGASTDIERREKRMRYEDALCAISSSSNGIVPGSGIVLYEIAENLNPINESSKIIMLSLKEPFNQIINNSGLDKEEIITEIKNNNFEIIYNVNKEKFEKINETEVIDPTSVLISSISNAVSISGMLLTTTSLIINEHRNEVNKISSYTEL